VDHEAVLHDRAEVVIDVHDDGQFVPRAGAPGEHDVVPVAQDMAHHQRTVDRDGRQALQPSRQPVVAHGELAADALRDELVTGHLREHGEQRCSLRTSDLDEGPGEFGEGQCSVHFAAGTCDRVLHSRVHNREQAAGESQQLLWVGASQHAAHVGEQRRLASVTRPTDAERACAVGLRRGTRLPAALLLWHGNLADDKGGPDQRRPSSPM